jgi:hypothetical protein
LIEAEERVEVRGVCQDLKSGVEEVKETVDAGIDSGHSRQWTVDIVVDTEPWVNTWKRLKL